MEWFSDRGSTPLASTNPSAVASQQVEGFFLLSQRLPVFRRVFFFRPASTFTTRHTSKLQTELQTPKHTFPLHLLTSPSPNAILLLSPHFLYSHLYHLKGTPLPPPATGVPLFTQKKAEGLMPPAFFFIPESYSVFFSQHPRKTGFSPQTTLCSGVATVPHALHLSIR